MTKDEIMSFLVSHKQELRERYGVTRIGLFGSYARGDEAAETGRGTVAREDRGGEHNRTDGHRDRKGGKRRSGGNQDGTLAIAPSCKDELVPTCF